MRGPRRNAPWEGVQVLFMDYLTCLGYNPPKASIRIIASSSSRLRGCSRPLRDLASTEKRRERGSEGERGGERETDFAIEIPLRSESASGNARHVATLPHVCIAFSLLLSARPVAIRTSSRHEGKKYYVALQEKRVSSRRGKTFVRAGLRESKS